MVFEKLKGIFGVEREEKERAREYTLEELADEIAQLKKKSIEEAVKNSSSLLDRVSKIRSSIEKLSKELADAEPGEDVHARIYKPVEESRRLLLKKMKRAIVYIYSIPDPSWKNLIDFNRSLRRSLNIFENAQITHGRSVAMLFRDKVGRLHAFTERLRSISQNLNKNLRRGKIQIEELDKISSFIFDCNDLKGREKKLMEKKQYLKKRDRDLQKAIKMDEESLKDLRRSQRFDELREMKSELDRIEAEKRKIRSSIRAAVSGLSRPMRKMEKMIQRKEHAVESDVVDSLNSYMDDSLEAALSEDKGLPKFKALLRELKRLMEGKMELDEKERRKKLELVEKHLREDLVERLLIEYKEEEASRKMLEVRRSSSSVLKRKTKLERSIKNRKSELESVKGNLKEAEKKLNSIRKNINNAENNLEEASRSALGVEVLISN